MKRRARCILAFVLVFVTLAFSACISYDPSVHLDGSDTTETTQITTTPPPDETTATPSGSDTPAQDGDGYPNEAEDGYTKRY